MTLLTSHKHFQHSLSMTCAELRAPAELDNELRLQCRSSMVRVKVSASAGDAVWRA